MLKMLSPALAALALSACATEQMASHGPPDGRDCFATREISGYGVIDEHHVRVSTSPSRAYILTTDWDARDLDWGQRIALHTNPGGWICTGNGLGVEVTGGVPRRTYPITDISRAPPPAAQGS